MTSMQELKSRADKLAPVDPDVKVPAAIRAAAARSAALHQEAYQTEAPKDQNAPASPQPTAAAETGTEGKPQEAKSQEPTPAQAGAENTATTPKADDWEHKYNSMKGRYDRAEETVRGLNARITQLEGLMASTRAAPAPAPTPDQTFNKTLITDKDREDFGEDFISVAQRAAMEKVNPEIASLRAEIANLKGTVGTVAQQTQQTTQQTLWSYLDSELPNWKQINRDQNFIAWTNLQDPLSGGIRINMLKDAFNKGDGPRVLRFFKGYLADEAATAPAPVPKPDTQGKVSLEQFAAPGRASAPAATTPPGQKETITRAQIAAFYTDVQKGKYRGNEAEKVRLERMIFDAEAEGRIV